MLVVPRTNGAYNSLRLRSGLLYASDKDSWLAIREALGP